MMNEPVHLVVGADGLVGGALLRRLDSMGIAAVGTTRRAANISDRMIHLDLAAQACEWDFPWPVSVATICAAVTKAQACKDDPTATAAVNVTGISAIVSRLVAVGAFVIFLSTNQVFDGAVPHQSADAPQSPRTEYGRQKAALEQAIAPHGDSVAIVRFAKILGPVPALIPAWIDSLRKGLPIHPFSDMTLAPVPLSSAVTILSLIASLRAPGVFQFSGDEDISYADAARIGASALGLDQGLIQPVTVAASSFSESVPAFTSLDISRIESAFGLVPPTSRHTIETAFVSPAQLLGA
jgi:dTDP-4-dehydrorhamnose reductase